MIQPIGEPPATVNAGQSFVMIVDAEDQFGNLVTSFSGPVVITSPSKLAGTTVTASGGVATFNLAIDTTGTYQIKATSTNLSSITSSSFNVVAQSPSQMIFITNPPSSLTAGTRFGFEVEAEDQYGNVATGFDGALTATLSPNVGNATLGGSVTATASNGLAFFSGLTVDQAGSGYTIQVTSSFTTVTTTAFNVTPAAAHLVIPTQPPASITAGSPFGLSVVVADVYGNVETSFVGSVTIGLSSDPNSGVLNGLPTSPVTVVNGVASFPGLSLDTAASGYTIEATSGNLTVTTSVINVTPATPTQLEVLVQPPSNMVANANFGLGIVAEDKYGDRDPVHGQCVDRSS